MHYKKLTFILFLVFTLTGCGTHTLTLDDVTFDKSSGTILDYNGDFTNVIIPEKLDDIAVQKIGKGAFSNHALTELIIPNSVTYIGDGAFEKNNLVNLVIPDSVIEIGDGREWDESLEGEPEGGLDQHDQ